MTASFPNSIKDFGADHVNGDVLVPGDVNDLRAEVVALETYSFSPNLLLNGGFGFANRLQTPSTLTTIAQDKYSADQWRISRENADLQFQQADGLAETGLTSPFFGTYKKITNAGKLMIYQIIEGANSVPLRGKTIVFSIKMKASTNKTIRMAVLELQNTGTIDTIPATFVSAWGANSTDPTLGSNLAIITAAQSKNVTTAMQNFTVSVTVPSNSKNLICAVWSDSQFSANDTLSLAEAGLYVGPAYVTWRARPIQEELAMCQRYLLVYSSNQQHAPFAPGKCFSTTGFTAQMPFPVEMRAKPTLTVSAATDFEVTTSNDSVAVCSSLSLLRTTPKTCQIQGAVASGLVAGDGTNLFDAVGTGAARLIFSAEL